MYWLQDNKNFFVNQHMIYDKTLHLLFVHFQAKAERTVHHFHFTQWPDHGVPDKIKLVSFYRKVKRTKTTLNGPLTVHSR
jgi:protein tyrosine phosphatase